MEYVNQTLDFSIEGPSVITLGKFDALHSCHEILMKELQERGRQSGYKTVVFTFDIPPKNRLSDADAKVLTTNEEKYYIFEKTGIDYLIECPFTEEVMQMEPEQFIRWIVEALHVKCIVAGRDFHFGYRRLGDYKLLLACREKYGYEAIILDKMQEDGRDISSTFIREELSAGRIEKANHLLGYHFFIQSRVIHGNQIGRKMGIPTINMQTPEEKLLPPNGVYVTRVLYGGKIYKSISNVGCKPTIAGEHPIGVETYILDFSQEVYEEEIVVEFLAFIRPEKKFASLEELQKQIERDIAVAELL